MLPSPKVKLLSVQSEMTPVPFGFSCDAHSFVDFYKKYEIKWDLVNQISKAYYFLAFPVSYLICIFTKGAALRYLRPYCIYYFNLQVVLFGFPNV